MLDWLTMPAEERELVLWLTRKRHATHDEILAAFGAVLDVDALLEEMLSGGYIALDDGIFTVVYRSHQKRTTREFPDDIWSRVDSKFGRSKGSSGDSTDGGA
jgi:hypothetical protein